MVSGGERRELPVFNYSAFPPLSPNISIIFLHFCYSGELFKVTCQPAPSPLATLRGSASCSGGGVAGRRTPPQAPARWPAPQTAARWGP